MKGGRKSPTNPSRIGITRSTDHQVWAVLGELLFWLSRKGGDFSGRISFLFQGLKSYPEALPDALRQLERCNYMRIRPTSVLQSLLVAQPEAVRDGLHGTLQCGRHLTSVFRGGPIPTSGARAMDHFDVGQNWRWQNSLPPPDFDRKCDVRKRRDPCSLRRLSAG